MMPAAGDDRLVRRTLLAALVLVPVLPDFGLFTNSDSPKWALLTALVLAALLVVTVRAFRGTGPVRVPYGDHLALLVIIALMMLLWGPRAPEKHATFRAWAAVGTLAAAGILAARYLRDDPWAGRALAVVVATGAAVSLAGIGQRAIGMRLPPSTFGNPSFAAEFTAPVLVIAVCFIFGRKRRLAGLLAAVPLTAYLVLAKSRADWLGLCAGLVTLLLLEVAARQVVRLPPALFAGGILAAATALPFVVTAFPVPLLGRSDTVAVRACTRTAAFRMAADHPATGVGLEGFRAHYPKYRDPEEARLSLRREVTFPHHLPGQVAAETGYPGLLLLGLMLFVPLWSGFFGAYQRPQDRVLAAATASLAAVIASAQFSEPLRHPASALLFFVLSGIVVVRRPKRLVTDLRGRYRRLWPMLLLLFPVFAGAGLLGPHLLADGALKAARDRLAGRGGEFDEETSALLRASLAREETPDPLRMLAFGETVSGRPESALILLERLFAISPWDEHGRIEKARALLKLGRAAEALPILEDLSARRPGDDIVWLLRLVARSAGDAFGAQQDLLARLRAAPPAEAARLARQADRALPAFSLAVVRAAERLGTEGDPERALAILSGLSGGEARYHEAVLLAAGGRLDAAMDALRAAAAEGAAERPRLAADPRLDPLRGRADFRAMAE